MSNTDALHECCIKKGIIKKQADKGLERQPKRSLTSLKIRMPLTKDS